MRIRSHTGGMAETHAWLVESTDGNLLVDAPLGTAKWLTDLGVRVDHLLLTHQHYDHIEDAAAVQATGATVHAFAPYSTALTLEDLVRASGRDLIVQPYTIDHLIADASSLRLAGLDIKAIHLPGHSPDSLVFHPEGSGLVFVGDTLFAGSIGRADLPGGDLDQLLDGIARHLLVLPAETRVFPGHGPETTIGREAATNPFLR